tara:strand:- start:169 stop:369 length:201 start_codon:yes stop_codon:yes gene_type:complete
MLIKAANAILHLKNTGSSHPSITIRRVLPKDIKAASDGTAFSTKSVLLKDNINCKDISSRSSGFKE